MHISLHVVPLVASANSNPNLSSLQFKIFIQVSSSCNKVFDVRPKCSAINCFRRINIDNSVSLSLITTYKSTKFCMKLIAVISHENYYGQFIVLFVNWCNYSRNQLIRQFFPIPNKINAFVDRRQ
jgi:hypothetical protein